jgi:hypothetical protein
MEKDEIQKKKDEKWIEVSFLIEAMAVDKEVVENALKEHVDKMSKEVSVYDTQYQETVDVKDPAPDVEKAYSRLCEVKFFVKNVETLIRVVLLYGPSSIEILSPNHKEVNIEELQNISNTLAGLLHQFAQAGAGGVVISPASKKEAPKK